MASIIAKASVEIPIGRYSGKISKVEITTSENEQGQPVNYVNLHVQTDKAVEGWNGQFRISMPFYLTKMSALGRLLTRSKIPFVVGQPWDSDSLEGKIASFDTVRNGNFTNPVLDSVFLS